MSTLAILLSAFVLCVVALLVFIWSQRSGLFERSPKGAEVIFARGEIGHVEPAATPRERGALQGSVAQTIPTGSASKLGSASVAPARFISMRSPTAERRWRAWASRSS